MIFYGEKESKTSGKHRYQRRYQQMPNTFSFVSIKQVLFHKKEGVVFETSFWSGAD